jgi:hypothetical protein
MIEYRLNDQDLNDMLEKLNSEKSKYEILVERSKSRILRAEQHGWSKQAEYFTGRLNEMTKRVKLLEQTIAMIATIKKEIPHPKQFIR